MQIKVCGMRDSANIRRVEALGIDLMGFIFYPRSARYVERRPDYLPRACGRVGVFVDANAPEIQRRAEEFALTHVQLHGAESPAFCADLRRLLGPDVKVVKALPAKSADALAAAAAYDGVADMLVFDTPCPTKGGSGATFDWSLLDSYRGGTPFLLSGGIGPGAAEAIRAITHPMLAGIDLNSRFETAPALKDAESLRIFINDIRL